MTIFFSEQIENIKHAIKLRKEKDHYTDFYRKLQVLNDRIFVYKELFLAKRPKFLELQYEESKSYLKSQHK